MAMVWQSEVRSSAEGGKSLISQFYMIVATIYATLATIIQSACVNLYSTLQ